MRISTLYVCALLLWLPGMLRSAEIGAAAEAPALEVREAWVPQPPPGVPAAAYLILHNPGSEAVEIVGAQSDAAARIEFHRSVVEDGIARMEPLDAIVVPAGGETVLEPKGLHLMLFQPRSMRPGDTIELEFRLRDGGTLRARATVR